MKKCLIIASLVLLSGAAHAEERCEKVSRISSVIMENRQMGIPMPASMEAASGNELVESFVIAAYERPAYSTPEYKERAIREFSDEQYLECVKSTR